VLFVGLYEVQTPSVRDTAAAAVSVCGIVVTFGAVHRASVTSQYGGGRRLEVKNGLVTFVCCVTESSGGVVTCQGHDVYC
jgi:hypothetical protein